MRFLAGLVVAALTLCACAADVAPTPAPVRLGLEGLLADLSEADAQVTVGAVAADGGPMAARSTIVCVGREKLRVYEYGSVEEADDLAASIDPQDPSMIGNAIVEWIGAPKFWLRDRIIVMYMGQSQPLVELVSTLMGAPFAVGEGLGRGFGAVDSC